MNNKCLICKRVKIYPICGNCRANPFKVEKCRQMLAERRDVEALEQLYRNSYISLEDLNTSEMWNGKLEDIGSIKDQDGMTKERIKIAYRFLPNSSKKVLDIGAGAGFLEEYLDKRRDISIYANDFSDVSIKRLKDKFKGNFQKQSIYNIKYPNNFFDCVFLLEVLEHIPPAKVFGVLKNVKSILVKNGYLVVSVPMNEDLETMDTNPNGHLRDYTESLIKRELELAGFNILKSETLYAFNKFYSIKKGLSKIFKNRWKPNNIIIKSQIK